jgi:hypothetical protein
MFDADSDAICKQYDSSQFEQVVFEKYDGPRIFAHQLEFPPDMSLGRRLWYWNHLPIEQYDPARIKVRREGDMIVMCVMPLHFLNDPDYWPAGNTQMPQCNHCFPRDVHSIKPCLPNCIFTARGDGPPVVVDSMFVGKTPPAAQPLFVIAYGPPASGKSDIIAALHDMMPGEFPTLTPDTTIDVNVDRVFQKGPLGDMYATARGVAQAQGGSTYTQRLYRYYRWLGDQVADLVLNEALLQRYNVLWESTGESVAWTQREISRIKQAGYHVVLVFPVVSQPVLMDRLRRRPDQEATLDSEMSDKIQKAFSNLVSLLEKRPCPDWIAKRLRGVRKECFPDRVILYNNDQTPAERTILFDSERPRTAQLDKLKTLVPDHVLSHISKLQ